ncbi:type VII secretion-associated protein, partial [Mycobacterium avium subsp. paratuberculosis]
MPADREVIEAALDAIDDPVALVGERPVAVEALWKTALRSACCACDGAVVVYPSWWPPARVRTVSAAAATLAGEAR